MFAGHYNYTLYDHVQHYDIEIVNHLTEMYRSVKYCTVLTNCMEKFLYSIFLQSNSDIFSLEDYNLHDYEQNINNKDKYQLPRSYQD